MLKTRKKTLDIAPKSLYTCLKELHSESNEQEEYIATFRHRESAMVETDTVAVMEWAWELQGEFSAQR